MIGAAYCATMAQYNAWQNNQLFRVLDALDEAELTADRGGGYGCTLGTLSHLLWGDQMWMARFDGGVGATVGMPESRDLFATLAGWRAARSDMDARIIRWADGLEDADLERDMTWFSAAMGCDITKPVGMLVTHMFNHQTHHRGQIHGMLTAGGTQAPVSDLFFMPDFPISDDVSKPDEE